MSARIGIRHSGIWLVILVMVAVIGCAPVPPAMPTSAAAPAAPAASPPPPAAPPPAPASSGPPPHDILNAVLWMQRSVEYRATTTGIFALAQIRLDQALADPNWTAIIPKERPEQYQALPPAVILDVDETILDNSDYQAWNVVKDTSFDPKTWTVFVNSVTSRGIPGAAEFCQYAVSKGVKVFYVSNRTAEEEPATRKNLEKFGFPIDNTVDTVLTSRERPDWTSAKGTRRTFIAKEYRVLLNLGDNFSDFTDDYRGNEAQRLAVLQQYKEHWGHDWLMLPNPTYGSFESATFNHDFKKSAAEQRKAKRDALEFWPGP
jgi:5'-nucleotidase (lipoprotein e(P4) family)